MARFNYDDLINKSKEDLDKIKLAMDIYQSEDKYAFERKKFRTENLRFFAIALLTAVISLGSSYVIESFKLQNANRQEVKKEFVELKQNYLSEKDKDKQNELACALASFENTIDDKTIKNAQLKFDLICTSISYIQRQTETISSTDTSSSTVKEALVKLADYDKQLQKLTQQKKSAPASEQVDIGKKINLVNNDINKVVNSAPEIKMAVKSTENIEVNVKKIEKAKDATEIASAEVNTSKSAVTWFKQDYFLQFGEYRILLQSLDKNLGIQVQVCKTTGVMKCNNPLRNEAQVTFGTPLQFSDNGHVYRINLEAIDHAGKNPFTLAAYITFETLK